jgi:hypothetical protein
VSERLLRLARRIRDECGELEWLVARVQEGWHRAQRSSDDFYVDSVALNLHSFYAGLGRLFEMVAAAIDGSVPRGQNWHQMLLEQMVAEVPWVRPALMSEETRRMLDEYRGFRHVVRNVYAFRFDLAKVQKLVQVIVRTLVKGGKGHSGPLPPPSSRRREATGQLRRGSGGCHTRPRGD